MLELIGHVDFNGSRRAVYLDSTGQQYILGDEGEKIFGLFLIPEELAGYSESTA
jgi:hypothetical protein